MKIAMVQPDLRERFSFMYLSAILKRAKHKVQVFITNIEAIDLTYDVYCFSPTTLEYKEALYYAATIKNRTGAKILFGGAHVTFNKIDSKIIDAICIGEGYEVILDMLTGTDKIYKAKTKYNINDLPMPDYDLYYNKYPELANKPTKQVYIVSGCPYKCAFCYNPAYNDLYKGQTVCQQMNINKAIAEIKWLKDNYGFEYLQFISDNMTINKKWFKKFLKVYKKRIRIKYEYNSYNIDGNSLDAPYPCYDFDYREQPFLMNCRANEITKEIVKLLKESGCDRVDFGIEHGNDFIRNDILKRNMSKEQIINCGKWFKEANIRFQTTNIFGLPHEDFNKAWESVILNRKFKPEISKACILQPFENTDIYKYAKKNDLLKEDFEYTGTTYQIGVKDNRANQTAIKIDNEKQIIRLSYLFDLFVKLPIPKWLGFIICSLSFDNWYKKYYNYIFRGQVKKYDCNNTGS